MGSGTPEFQEFLHVLQMMFGAVFLYHGIQVYRLSRNDRFVPYTGVAAMSLAAAAYYTLPGLYRLDVELFWLRVAGQAIWTSGVLVACFHFTALEAFLELKSRWIRGFKAVAFAAAAISALSLISTLLTGRMLIFSTEPMASIPSSLPAKVGQAFSPNALGVTLLGALLLAEIGGFAIFLASLVRRKSDHWLIAGVTLSVLGIGNDIVMASRPQSYGFSFLFLATFIEIVRLTILLERANREKLLRIDRAMRLTQIGELTATIAHELETPLTAIIASSQLGLKQALQRPESEAFVTSFTTLERASKRMMRITSGLRNHARNSPGLVIPFDPAAILQETASLLAPLYERDGIAFELRIPSRLPLIVGEAGILQQVLINLLQNARDATESRSERRIRLEAEPRDGSIALLVSDSGAGVSPEIREKIFEPFFTTKSPGKGTGIGLSFALTEIRAMKGDLRIASTSPNGTTFEVLLPLAR